MADLVTEPPPTNPAQDLFVLNCSSVGLEGQVVSTPAGMPNEINGQPVKYVWRRVAKPGEWGNKDVGFTLKLSNADLQHLKATGELMLASGDEVPVVKDHSEASDDVLGYVKGWKVEDGWLCSLNQIIGDTSFDTLNKNYLSGAFRPNYTDTKQKNHGLAIVHVATTPRPVILGQELMAASRSANGSKLIHMSMAEGPSAMDMTPQTGVTSLPCSAATLNKLHSADPKLAAVPPEGKMDHIANNWSANASQADMADAGGSDCIANMSAADIQKKANENRQMWKASAASKSVSAESLQVIKDGIELAIIGASALSPNEREAAKTLLCSTADGRISAASVAKFLCGLTGAPVTGRTVARTVPGAAEAPPETKLPFQNYVDSKSGRATAVAAA